MYIERVPNRNSPPAVLLRETYWEDGKSKKRTLSNLSKLPDDAVELLRAYLKGKPFIIADEAGFEVVRTLSHGHVKAVTETMKKLGLSRLIGGKACRERNLVMAMIASRILEPASKLATSRLWKTHTLSEIYNLEDVKKEELYKALDWLLERQPAIEKRLTNKHLSGGDLVLYDLTSTYLEGRKCSLARHGYSRDHRPDKMQIEFGLVTDREGRPVSVEVFEGNTSDPMTLGTQIEKLKKRFGLRKIIVVGDRGMVTTTRIEQDLKPNGYSWISALRHDSIRRLAEGPLQLSLFDERNLAEIESPHYPGERLVACRNPGLADESARKRKELLALTETGLTAIQKAVETGKLRDCGAIGRKVESTLKKYRMQRFFEVEIDQDLFSFRRLDNAIAREATLDGIYVLRSAVPVEDMDAAETVRVYKRLSKVERAFRTLKTGLDVRPVFHYLANRVRAHVFLCMLAYYVEWEMRRRLAPLLFVDEDRQHVRTDPVVASGPSKKGRKKLDAGRSETGFSLHSFSSLLREMGTLGKVWFKFNLPNTKDPVMFSKMTTPNAMQKEAFRLLEVKI